MGGMLAWIVHEMTQTRAAISGYVQAIVNASRVADYHLSGYTDPHEFQAAVYDFAGIMRRADRARDADFNDFWRVAA
jgi:hypothetical protein